MTAFNVRPSRQTARVLVEDEFAERDFADFDLVVAGFADVPLRLTCALPVLFGVPSLAYSAPPIATMCFTWQSVSTC